MIFQCALISFSLKNCQTVRPQAPGPHVGSPAVSSPVSHGCRPFAFPCAPVTLQELWQLWAGDFADGNFALVCKGRDGKLN